LARKFTHRQRVANDSERDRAIQPRNRQRRRQHQKCKQTVASKLIAQTVEKLLHGDSALALLAADKPHHIGTGEQKRSQGIAKYVSQFKTKRERQKQTSQQQKSQRNHAISDDSFH